MPILLNPILLGYAARSSRLPPSLAWKRRKSPLLVGVRRATAKQEVGGRACLRRGWPVPEERTRPARRPLVRRPLAREAPLCATPRSCRADRPTPSADDVRPPAAHFRSRRALRSARRAPDAFRGGARRRLS